jgi:hypothetical protein
MMNGEPIYKLAVSFANRYNHVLGTDVDGAHDEFVKVCKANAAVFEKLAESTPARIAVLSYMDDFNGDNLTLDAKRNFDVDTCPIVDEVLNSIASGLSKGTNTAEVRRAIDDVMDSNWDWFVEIVFDVIARKLVYDTLKKELMIPDA